MSVLGDVSLVVAIALVILTALIPRKGGRERECRGRLAIASVVASLFSIGVRLL